jgi:hypothetical protein
LLSIALQSCELEQEINMPEYTIKGRLINVNNPSSFDGKHLFLESRYTSIYSGTTYVETIAEATVYDSGRFEMTYKSDPAQYLSIYCIELPNFLQNVVVNRDINPVFYEADSCSLLFQLVSSNPISAEDTFFIMYNAPAMVSQICTLLGPKDPKASFLLKGLNFGSYAYRWGRGYNDLKKNGPFRIKNAPLRGDPFVDSVTIQY